MTTYAVQNEHKLTPAERQIILRKLKHGPQMDRAALAEYAKKLRREILAKRERPA